MTRINLLLQTPSPSGIPIAADGEVTFRPTRKQTVVGSPDVTILPAPFTEEIGSGGLVSVELAPTGVDWAWELRFAVVGMRRWTEYVVVPEAEDIDYSELIRVDPRSLEPLAEPTAVWYPYVEALRTEAEEAKLAAEDSRDAADAAASSASGSAATIIPARDAAAASATASAGSATASAGSATAAAGSATAAAGSATAASGSATTAAGHVAAALGHRNAAADSATAAASSAAANIAQGYVRTLTRQVVGEQAGPVPTTPRGTGPVFGTPAKFGASALRSGQYFQRVDAVAPDPGATGLTIEHWFYATGAAATPAISLVWSLGTNLWAGIVANTGHYRVVWTSNTALAQTSPAPVADSQWHHIAVQTTRSGGISRDAGFWVDGIPVAGTAAVGAALAWDPNLGILGFDSPGFDYPTNPTASVDDLRVSNVLRYTKGVAFTPPTTPAAVDANTLLLHRGEANETAVRRYGYPARPVGAPGGSIEYIGLDEPTDWIDNDRWYKA